MTRETAFEQIDARDYFAGHALAGLCACERNHEAPAEGIAARAYAIADAMLREREGEQEDPGEEAYREHMAPY